MHGTFFVIFQVFHDFQSLWEPWNIDKTKVLKTNGSLMQVESIAEWSILQYFWHALIKQ